MWVLNLTFSSSQIHTLFMNIVPEVRYARADNVSIAYSRWGAGDQLVVYAPPLVSNIELMWELPEWERTLNWAGRHHEVIMIDKRGVGLSDRVTQPSSLEENVKDVLAVMDAESIEAANILGHSEGGTIGVALAALHPQRVRRLVLVDVPAMGAPPALLKAFSDRDEAPPTEEEEREQWLSLVRTWGRPESTWLESFAPSLAGDSRVRRWWERFERQSSSSGALLAMLRSISSFNLMSLVDRIEAPTLVGHASRDRVVHVSNGRLLAERIEKAKYIEWDCDDHVWNFAPNWREAQNDMIEFVTGVRPGSGARKLFSTVLFTDIVDSTKRAREMGDEGWRAMIELHDSISRLRIEKQGGQLIRRTGDGILATFPDPGRAVSAALELSMALSGSGVPIRAGLHMGQVEIRDDGEITGIAVNIAARVQALANEGEVLISQTLCDMLMGSEFTMHDRGEHHLKGIDGAWRVHQVSS